MPYMITEACIQCGSCKPFCKNKAIHDDGPKYWIDPAICQTCGTCSQYCPIDGAMVKLQEQKYVLSMN